MRKFGAVGIVFAGIMLISQAIALSSVPITYATLAFDMGSLPAWVYLTAMIPALVALLLGVVLIIQRHAVAEMLFEDTEAPGAIEPQEALRLGLILMGIWLVASAVPSLLLAVSQVIQQSLAFTSVWEGYPVPGQDVWGAFSYTAIPALQLVIGVVLTRFAPSIAARLYPAGEESKG